MLGLFRSWAGRVLVVFAALTSSVMADELEALSKLLAGSRDAKTWLPSATLPPFNHWVTSLAFSPDGQTLYVGGKDQVAVVNVTERTVKATLPIPVGQVRSLAVTPDGKWLAAGGYQKLQVWDVAEAKLAHDLKGHRGVITAAEFSPDEFLDQLEAEHRIKPEVREQRGMGFVQ